MFGLPQNIDKSLQRLNTQKVINNVKSMSTIQITEISYDKHKWVN